MGRKWDYEKVKKYIENFEYKLLSKEYKNNKIKLLIKCNKGHIFECSFHNFKDRNSRCPYCNGKKITYNMVKFYIESCSYKLLSEDYVGNSTKLLIKCDKGHIFKMRWNNFQQGQRCPICDKSHKKNYEDIKMEIEKEKYKLITCEYRNSKEKLLIMCPNGHTYKSSWNNFRRGRRCPMCNITKGEKKIKEILDNNKIEYIYNKKYFKDLKGINGGLLRPDFIIPSLKIWIEYDGIQHFEPKDFAGKGEEWAEKEFILRKMKDEIKNEYAKEHDWKLIRIPYWEYDNIENILIKELNLK